MLQATPRVGLRLLRWTSQRLLGLVVVMGIAAVACDSKDPPSSSKPPSSRDNTGTDSNAPYELTTTLTLGSNPLSPGEITDLQIQIQPPGSHNVRVAIAGGSELAFLTDSVLLTDSTGHAQTKLTVARTGVGTVTLQALVDGAAPAYLDAHVVAPVEATLNVIPVYTGDRPFKEWHVAILDAPACPTDYLGYTAQATHTFQRPEDGAPLQLSAVPTGRPVSVLLRAEEYAFGCTPAVVVTNDTSQVVEVNVTDEPLVVNDLAFPLRFGVYTNSEPFWSDLTTYLATIGNAFRGDFAADSVALLSMMEQLATSPEAFRTSREARTWDTLLEVRLTAAGASQGLTSRVQRWLLDGARLLQSNTTLLGNVEAPNAKSATVQLSSVATLPAADVGIASNEVEATLNTSGTDDVVRLAFTLKFQPSRLFGALASQVIQDPVRVQLCPPQSSLGSQPGDAGVDAALDAAFDPSMESADGSVPAEAGLAETGLSESVPSDGGIADPPSVLAATIGCASVGGWLAEETGYAYEGCDAVCATTLCEQAINHLWQQVLDADTTEKTLQISAAGRAELDKRARVVGLTAGEWIGTTDLFRTEPKGTLQGCAESVTP